MRLVEATEDQTGWRFVESEEERTRRRARRQQRRVHSANAEQALLFTRAADTSSEVLDVLADSVAGQVLGPVGQLVDVVSDLSGTLAEQARRLDNLTTSVPSEVSRSTQGLDQDIRNLSWTVQGHGEGLQSLAENLVLVQHQLSRLEQRLVALPEDPSLPPRGAADDDMADPQEQVVIDCWLTGTFEIQGLLSQPQSRRADVVGRLERHLRSPQWSMHSLFRSEHHSRQEGLVGAYSSSVIARRDGTDLLPSLRPVLDEPFAEHRHETRAVLSPRSLTVDVHDFGVAVLALCVRVVVARVDTQQVTGRLNMLAGYGTGLSHSLVDACVLVAEEFGEAIQRARFGDDHTPEHRRDVAPRLTTRPQRTPHVSRQDLGWTDEPSLSLQCLFVFDTARSTESVINDLGMASEGIDVDDGGVIRGPDWVGVVARGHNLAQAMVRLNKLHVAYRSLYRAFDRRLLYLYENLAEEGDERRPRLAQSRLIEQRAIDEAGLRLDSMLAGLPPYQLAAWNALARLQGFSLVVDAVGRKIESLERRWPVTDKTTEVAAEHGGGVVRLVGAGALLCLTLVVAALVLLSPNGPTEQPFLAFATLGLSLLCLTQFGYVTWREGVLTSAARRSIAATTRSKG